MNIYEDKENNMQNSNLPSSLSNLALNKLPNYDKFMKNIKNPSQT